MITLEALPDHATTSKPHVLDLCSITREARETPPICRARTSDGGHAWLVTRHEYAKKLLQDDRLRKDPAPDENKADSDKPDLLKILMRDDYHDEAGSEQEQANARKLIHPQLAPRRVLNLRPRMEALVEEMLDALVSKGAAADLHADFSVPFVRTALGEVLGIPPADREWSVEMISRAANLGDPESASAAAETFAGFLHELMASRRTDPGDDLLSRVSVSDQENVVTKVMVVMVAGFASMVTQIDTGFLLFATHPEQREALARDPGLLPKAADEVLRTTGSLMLPRFARQDVEIGGVTIPANEMMLLDLTLANFDDEAFDRPERFDITRSPNPHLSFGHGPWTCTGAALARVQLQAIFGGLFDRLPTVHPAGPLDQLRKSADEFIGGIDDLLVSW